MNTSTCVCIKHTPVILLLVFVAMTLVCCIVNQTSELPLYKNNETLLLGLKPSKTIDDKNHQLIDLNNLQFLTNTQDTCGKCTDGFLLVILVHSSLSNVEHRAAIRKTWGKQKKCLKVLYFVGTSTDKNTTLAIQVESDKYHDIIQGNFKDSYRNLTYKHIMVLKWATDYCKQAKYIVKTDDDVMVNVNVLYEHLKKDHWGARNLIACPMKYNIKVVRSNCKWSVTKEEYSENQYPDYCKGPFIIYSADVVHRLLEESYKTRYFWIDDIHVTGTLAKRIGIHHTNLIHNWTLPTADELMARGPKFVKSFIYGPTNLDPDGILRIWKAILILIRANYTMIELLRKFNTTSIVEFLD